jgi:hypothetical protein
LNQFNLAGMYIAQVFNNFLAEVIDLTNVIAAFFLGVTPQAIVLILGWLPIYCIFFQIVVVPALVSFFRDCN